MRATFEQSDFLAAAAAAETKQQGCKQSKVVDISLERAEFQNGVGLAKAKVESARKKIEEDFIEAEKKLRVLEDQLEDKSAVAGLRHDLADSKDKAMAQCGEMLSRLENLMPQISSASHQVAGQIKADHVATLVQSPGELMAQWWTRR